jgi:hypothetical protein
MWTWVNNGLGPCLEQRHWSWAGPTPRSGQPHVSNSHQINLKCRSNRQKRLHKAQLNPYSSSGSSLCFCRNRHLDWHLYALIHATFWSFQSFSNKALGYEAILCMHATPGTPVMTPTRSKPTPTAGMEQPRSGEPPRPVVVRPLSAQVPKFSPPHSEMVNFSFPPSPERLQLEADLIFIENHITNPLQFAFLNKRALKLFEARWIPGYATVNSLGLGIDLTLMTFACQGNSTR